ncbi:hypothetical protein [Martelella sp. AMO21009]
MMIGFSLGLGLSPMIVSRATGGYLSETNTYFAAGVTDGGSAASPTYKTIVNTLVAGLKNAGVWGSFDYLHLLRGHDAYISMINLVNPSSNKASAINSPIFTPYIGYLGDGSSAYLTTGFDPTSGTPQFQRDSAHIGAWGVTSAGQSASALIGASVTDVALFPRNTSNVMTVRLNSTVSVQSGGVVTDASGHFVASRDSASTVTLYRNGSQLAQGTSNASAAVPASGLNYLQSYPAQYAARRIAIGHGGRKLSAQQVSDVNALFAAYIAATDALAA